MAVSIHIHLSSRAESTGVEPSPIKLSESSCVESSGAEILPLWHLSDLDSTPLHSNRCDQRESNLTL
jgi:hypothetical protein